LGCTGGQGECLGQKLRSGEAARKKNRERHAVAAPVRPGPKAEGHDSSMSAERMRRGVGKRGEGGKELHLAGMGGRAGVGRGALYVIGGQRQLKVRSDRRSDRPRGLVMAEKEPRRGHGEGERKRTTINQGEAH